MSVNLGNASHVDAMDGSTEISLWTKLKPRTAQNWCFVLPNLILTYKGREYVGLFIEY
jgi:hypothetical protein